IINDISIDLPHWRDKEDKAFTKLVDKIYSILTIRESKKEQSRGEATKKPIQLPNVQAGAMTGFIELLEDIGSRTDLYKLGEDLNLDLEDFIPILDAASLLNFVKIQEGDVELTEIGRKFAEATVLERKDLYRQQVLKYVPIITQIMSALNSKANGKMPEEFFLNILGRQFGVEEAVQQLNIAIDWGRYAELFAFDESAGQLYLERDTGE
ncbi:MAG: AAA-associated domain-containing protein, partial [Firmicutes bacterium]|nr:AAA-associated domain-containing protein [Bacillota bacterium]